MEPARTAFVLLAISQSQPRRDAAQCVGKKMFRIESFAYLSGFETAPLGQKEKLLESKFSCFAR
jgi:hypothetical protein